MLTCEINSDFPSVCGNVYFNLSSMHWYNIASIIIIIIINLKLNFDGVLPQTVINVLN